MVNGFSVGSGEWDKLANFDLRSAFAKKELTTAIQLHFCGVTSLCSFSLYLAF